MGLSENKRALLTRDIMNRENKETLNKNTSVKNDVKCPANIFILLICNFSMRV